MSGMTDDRALWLLSAAVNSVTNDQYFPKLREEAEQAHQHIRSRLRGDGKQGQAVAWEARRTDGSQNSRWEACTPEAHESTVRTGRYLGFENGPTGEARALYTRPQPVAGDAVQALPAKWRERAEELNLDDEIGVTHHWKLKDCADELEAAFGKLIDLKSLVRADEDAYMRALAERISNNAHPAEDGRLEVAYAIARHLRLGWTSALSTQPAPSALLVDDAMVERACAEGAAQAGEAWPLDDARKCGELREHMRAIITAAVCAASEQVAASVAVPEGWRTLLLNIVDNLNDMPISEDWAESTAEKLLDMLAAAPVAPEREGLARKATDITCTLGCGCEEAGVCFAEAHGKPAKCGLIDNREE